MRRFTADLMDRLMDLERVYSGELYEGTGLIDQVMAFAYYNANKALMNLGYPAPFAEEAEHVPQDILASLAPDADENHDFFSGPAPPT